MTKEDQILEILKQISAKLDEHSVILKEHSAILKEHSSILKEHSAILDEHSVKLDQHSTKLDEHKIILRALEHNTEIAKSERENIKSDLNQTIGKVGRIEKTINSAAKSWIG